MIKDQKIKSKTKKKNQLSTNIHPYVALGKYGSLAIQFVRQTSFNTANGQPLTTAPPQGTKLRKNEHSLWIL